MITVDERDIINHRTVQNAEELADAVAVLLEDAVEHPSTVYINPVSGGINIALVEDTLSDGSKVKNFIVTVGE